MSKGLSYTPCKMSYIHKSPMQCVFKIYLVTKDIVMQIHCSVMSALL